MSKFIKHGPCPKCGSKDNLSVYDDNENCESVGCNYHKEFGEGMRDDKPEIKERSKSRPVTPLLNATGVSIRERGISASATTKYKVTVNTDPSARVGHVYPYFAIDGGHVANKVRIKVDHAVAMQKAKGKAEDGKEFYGEGDWDNVALFGMQLFKKGGLAITITEGELDALAAFELTGSRFACVSVRGASSAVSDCARVLDYLESFEKVVLAFDMDEPGQKAAKEVAMLFTPGKCRIMQMDPEVGKDANDYLLAGKGKEFVDEWYRAPVFSPDGIKLGKNMWEEIVNHKDPKSVPYPWEGLNHHTYGIRQSELVVITAQTGIGKTSLLKEIEYSLLMDPELIEAKSGVGFLHFEEPNYDTVIGLMSIHDNKPYHLPDTARTEQELKKAYEEVICNDRVVIWDHFGSNSIDAVLAKVRHMAALGCKYIVIDHLSIIVSDQSGDERKQLDEISTKLKTLCMEKDLAILCVIHQNRQGEIRGTAGVEQLANIVMKLHRDTKDVNDWRRNITKIVIEKNRFCGRGGPCCWLFYNEMTGRLEELTRDQVTEYEEGGTGAGQEMVF